MNIQQLKSKIPSLVIPKATFENDESGEPVTSFFRPLLMDKKQIELKFKGIINSSPKRYETAFQGTSQNHFSFAIKLEQSVVDVLDSLIKKLNDGAPEDEEWYSKPIVTNKNVVIIKLPVKGDMTFKPTIKGTEINPFNLDGPNTAVGDKVSLTVKLGCWFMRNTENKYGVSLTANEITFGEVVVKRKKPEDDDVGLFYPF